MPIIGLDIGKRRFRAVELDKHKDTHVLNNFGTYDGQELNLNFSSEEAINTYSSAIKDFMRDHNFSTSNVVVALPEQDVFIRVIKAPKMSEKELKNYISLGADEYIPISLEDATFDVQIIDSEMLTETSEEMSVLLVASKNEILNKYVTFLRKANLVVRGLEPETLSLERVLGDTEQRSSASIIVNIGTTYTQIIVTYKGFVRFTRSLSIGGDELTKAIQKELNLDYMQAEEYKKVYGLDESQVEGKVFKAVRPMFDNILLEINRSKTYYTTHNPDVIINRVILSGGTALMPGLLLYIANKLDVEAELANPWRNIKISEKISHSRQELLDTGASYSTAVGLALKKV